MKVPVLTITLFTITMLLYNCNDHNMAADNHSIGNFRYVALQDFSYEQAFIKPGTEVEVLASMGGRDHTGDTVFYNQFIILNKQTGDTIRLLCPEITVQLPGTDNTSTATSSYNMDAGVTRAWYKAVDSSKSQLLNAANMPKLMTSTDTALVNHLLNGANAKNFVVLDERVDAGHPVRFKTAVGVLHFTERPW